MPVPSPTPEVRAKEAKLFASPPSFMAETTAEQRVSDLPSSTPLESTIPGETIPTDRESSEELVDYGSPLSSYRRVEDIEVEDIEMEVTEVGPSLGIFIFLLLLFFSL